MSTHVEKDPVTGRDTTGHSWDGLRELNTPLPKWWLYVFYACIAIAVVMFILLPSIPYGPGYFRGLRGYSQRAQVAADIRALSARRAAAMERIAQASFAEIKAEPDLLAIATTAGRAAFAENCAPCHGAGGGGNLGYPALAAGGWIWGGTLDEIQRTITHGIRSGDPEARDSQMPPFGQGVLSQAQIEQVADFVSVRFFGLAGEGKDLEPGAKLYADNCAVCHGAQGEGNRSLGAPRLASRVHLYGGTRESVIAQVTRPHMGVMPAWNTRFPPGLIKSLALYVHGLGGGEEK